MSESEFGTFFQNVIDAGAIVAGFCGTFLAFRIQREAEFYRGPGPWGAHNEQHFSSSFLLIILASLSSLFSGFVVPLFFMAGLRGSWLHPRVTVAGLLVSLILLLGYFINELIHYRILGNRHPEFFRA